MIRSIGPLGIRYPVDLQEKGHGTDSHKHNFDHVTICTLGSYRVEAVVDGEKVTTEIYAPRPGKPSMNMLLIKAGIEHKLTALEDNSKYECLYLHRDARGELVENYTGWPKAYG